MGKAIGEILPLAIKNWMAAHNAAIMAVLLLVLSVKLVGDHPISGLSS